MLNKAMTIQFRSMKKKKTHFVRTISNYIKALIMSERKFVAMCKHNGTRIVHKFKSITTWIKMIKLQRVGDSVVKLIKQLQFLRDEYCVINKWISKNGF